MNWSIPKAEIGCYTDIKYVRKGITTRAMKLFLDYCFNEFSFKKVYIRTHESNKAAQIIAERCGFQLEGIIRMDYVKTSGEIVDLMYYGRLK